MMTIPWTPTKLSEVLEPISRSEAVDPVKEYRLLGVRLGGGGAFHRETKRGSQISAKALSLVRTGDFIYSRLFAWRGAFGVIGSELDGCYVSGEFPTFMPVPGKLDVEFLRLWFCLPTTISRVEADCTGSTPLTRNRFKEHFFLAMEIPLPSLEEQRRIVARIEELAAKIDETRNLRYKAIEQTASFVSSVHLYLAATRTVALGDILLLDEQREPVTPGREYPQVGIKGFGGGLFLKPAVSFTDTTYKTFNRLYAGALVLSQVKGWEGAVAVCPPELAGSYASPEYRTFRCANGKVLPEYLAFVAVTPWFWTKLKTLTRGVGARRERTRPERFLEMKMEMPTLENQKKGLLAFQGVDPLKHLQAETAAELDALLPSILDKAFKGGL